MPTYNFSFFDNNDLEFSPENFDHSDMSDENNPINYNYALMNNQFAFWNVYYDDPDYHHNLNPDIAMDFLP